MSGSSPQLTLKKGAPGDQVWDLLCVQLASYLERGPLMWMMPLHLHVNQKSDYDIWTYLAFVWFGSNLQHTLTIRHCMFCRKKGAEGSVLQTSSPLKPLGQLNSNFICRLLRVGEQKFVQMVMVALPWWPPRPYIVKPFKNLLLNQMTTL